MTAGRGGEVVALALALALALIGVGGEASAAAVAVAAAAAGCAAFGECCASVSSFATCCAFCASCKQCSTPQPPKVACLMSGPCAPKIPQRMHSIPILCVKHTIHQCYIYDLSATVTVPSVFHDQPCGSPSSVHPIFTSTNPHRYVSQSQNFRKLQLRSNLLLINSPRSRES